MLTAIAVFWIYPFLWMLATSLKTTTEVFRGLARIPEQFMFENYVRAWTAARFDVYFINTVVIAATVVAVVVIQGSMAGYALGRRNPPGRNYLIGVLVAAMLMPVTFTIIPVFDLMLELCLLNTRTSVILGQIGLVPPLYVLLFMGFSYSIHRDIEDSAAIDGAGFVRIYWHVMLRMTTLIIATVVIFQFMDSWNDLLRPLVFTLGRPSARTLAVGMYAFAGDHMVDWTVMAAGASISIVPLMVLFVFMQRHFVRSHAGAVKG